MELFLNLAWLLLALPAYWLWRGSSRNGGKYRFTSLQCLLALSCTLVMLFPVISATDDLRAMRTELEETPASKRSLRQTTGEKASLWNNHTAPALLAAPVVFTLAAEHHDLPHDLRFSLPERPALLPAARAPPVSRLT
jgi:hypothetical protein